MVCHLPRPDIIKGAISDLKFQVSLFLHIPIFLYIKRELIYPNLPLQQLLQKQRIFDKRDNSLFWGINYRRR